jgi:hypothetical protein
MNRHAACNCGQLVMAGEGEPAGSGANAAVGRLCWCRPEP